MNKLIVKVKEGGLQDVANLLTYTCKQSIQFSPHKISVNFLASEAAPGVVVEVENYSGLKLTDPAIPKYKDS